MNADYSEKLERQNAKWNGKGFLCRACGEAFASRTGFDDHRQGRCEDKHPDYGRYCLSQAEMFEDGWKCGEKGWLMPADEKRPEHWR